MSSQSENPTAAELEARQSHAKQATGPRTAEGKRRSCQNARKHGLFANAGFYWDAAITLGEDPRDFERLLKGLVLARQPADTLEMVLVEDIALLVWKKARLDRAEVAVQVRNLQKHDLERRKQFIQVGREISDSLESEVREKGLRCTLDAPGKFEQVLSFLENLMEMVEKNDFSSNMQEFLRGLYGTEPTLRGAGLYNNYFKLAEMKPGSQEFEDAKTLMRARLAEEISDVAQEYELFLHEHVENTRAARVAATAPSHAQWAAIIRQQNALHRQLERKIRLLEEMQEKRKREEERFPENYEASLRRNPSDAPGGGGHGPNLTRSAGPASAGPACRPKGRRYPQNETPGGGRQASNRKKILNRGNEPKTLLKTKGLTDTTPSKRTPFCAEKVAIKAQKSGISVPKATGDAPSPAPSGRTPARPGKAQGRLKAGEKAALPPDVRKASGFPAQTASLLPLGSAGRPSLPAEPKRLVRAEALGKAKPFRTSGGIAALRCCPSGTLTRPCGKATVICRNVVRSRRTCKSWRRNPGFSPRVVKGGVAPVPACREPRPSARPKTGSGVLSLAGWQKLNTHVASGDWGKTRGGLRHSCCQGGRAQPPG